MWASVPGRHADMRLRSYLINSGLALVYAAIYVQCYVWILNYYFDYAGFALYPRDTMFLTLAYVIAVLPTFCYRGWRTISSVISVFVYALLYIPIILSFALGSSRSIAEVVLIQLTFMFCMCLLFLADSIVVKNPLYLQTRWELVRPLLAVTIAFTLYMLVVYRGNLHFVSFGPAIYEQRSANAELGAGILARYLSSWLSTVCVPLCLAYGLVGRNYKYFAAGSVACVTLYMASASKVVILLPLVYIGFYVVFSSGRVRVFYPTLVSALSLILAALLKVTTLGSMTFLISSLLLYRTIGNGGQLAVAYYDFFSFYPSTDYSHVMGLSLLTHPYPYGADGIGQVIGKFYWNADVNANASFWATDGIAAMGLFGVAIISVFCAFVFILMNSLTRAYDKRFVALCFIPFIMTLLNASLFSSLWSGGAIFLLLYFLLNKRPTTFDGTVAAPIGVA